MTRWVRELKPGREQATRPKTERGSGALARRRNGRTWCYGGRKERDGGFECDVDDFLATFADGHEIVTNWLAVSCGLNAVAPGAKPHFLLARAANDDFITVNLNFHRRVFDLDDQRAVGCLDAKDGGDEVGNLSQAGGVGDADSGDGHQKQRSGHGQGVKATAGGRQIGRVEIECIGLREDCFGGANDGCRRALRLLKMGESAFEQVGNLSGGLEAVGRLFGQQAIDDGGEPGGHVRVELTDRRMADIAYALEHGHRRVGPKGRAPAGHGVDCSAQCEEVGSRVDGLAARLFRRHVLRRSGDHTALGEAGVVDGASQPEVGELDALDAVFEQDVGRLDIAVDDSLSVCRSQRAGGLHADAEDLADLERTGGVELILDRAARDVFHDEIRQAVKLIDRVNRDDVLVHDGCNSAGFAREPAASAGGVCERGGEYLDGDGALEGRVTPLEHDAHAAAPEHLEDVVRTKSPECFGALGIARVEEVKPAAIQPGVVAQIVAIVVMRERIGMNASGCIRGARLAAEQRCIAPEVTGGGHSLELTAAGWAGFEVGGQLGLLGLGEPVFEREAQSMAVAVVLVLGRGHGISPGQFVCAIDHESRASPSASSMTVLNRAMTRLRAM